MVDLPFSSHPAQKGCDSSCASLNPPRSPNGLLVLPLHIDLLYQEWVLVFLFLNFPLIFGQRGFVQSGFLETFLTHVPQNVIEALVKECS